MVRLTTRLLPDMAWQEMPMGAGHVSSLKQCFHPWKVASKP